MFYHKNQQNKKIRNFFVLLVIFITLLALQYSVYATPTGPTVSYVKNETATLRGSSLVNTTGGSITTMNLNMTAQNLKWKAFVGNVTGGLVLADTDGYSLYNWSLSTVMGEIYATRSSTLVSWDDIECANKTHIGNEETAINHTDNPNDNISATFNSKNHDSFYVGTVGISDNECYSIHTNVDNQSQSSNFEEVILYDGSNSTNGDMLYVTTLEQNTRGYNNDTYDFQMIVPEYGYASWTGATAYYFYVELT